MACTAQLQHIRSVQVPTHHAGASFEGKELQRVRFGRNNWKAVQCLHSAVRDSLPGRGPWKVTVAAAHRAIVALATEVSKVPQEIGLEKDSAGLKLERSYLVTAEQLAKAKEAIDKFIDGVESSPEKRDGAFPYYLLHEEGTLVYGTVLLFHGFSSKPDQIWRLAQYLFDSGFNVYQPAISNHYLINPDKNWPQVDLRLKWKAPVRQKFLQDPVLSGALAAVDTVTSVTAEQLKFLAERIKALSPDMKEIIAAINQGDYSESFDKFYDSSHLNYLTDAEDRLAEVSALPGPAFTVGLSVGGAVALALAAAQADKVARTVAYAPLLKEENEVKRQFSLIAGPLDVKSSGWDPDLQFTVGCFAATDVFGTYVRGQTTNLAQVPTFLMLTENDDSANIPANKEFTANLRSLAGDTGVPHLEGMYFAAERVPHPMVDPTEVSQGMSNKYWASLYQETFRFLTEGTVNQENLKNLGQDSALPEVAPVN